MKSKWCSVRPRSLLYIKHILHVLWCYGMSLCTVSMCHSSAFIGSCNIYMFLYGFQISSAPTARFTGARAENIPRGHCHGNVGVSLPLNFPLHMNQCHPRMPSVRFDLNECTRLRLSCSSHFRFISFPSHHLYFTCLQSVSHGGFDLH